MEYVRFALQVITILIILGSMVQARESEQAGNIGGTLRYLVQALVFAILWLGVTIGPR